MAKQKSLIKIEGTIDDLTFYKSANGYIVRKKGGVSKEKILNDPAFERTRENGMEFGQAATTGKILRRAIIELLSEVKDPTVTSRLTKVMSQVKNEDLTSPRGKRNVATGLGELAGKMKLKNFNFNSNAPLERVLLTEYELNTTTGEVTIPEIVTAKQVSYPKGATHVSFRSGFVNVDFSNGENDFQLSPVQNETINKTPVSISLTPLTPAVGIGNAIYVLYVGFYQEVNGVQYQLNNGAHNALSIIEVL